MMIEGIRKAANNWLGKAVLTVLFSILILSFAVWGIGDIFRGGVSNTVANVGRTEIGAETFRQAFQRRVQQEQQRIRGFNNEQARQFGLDRQVLNELVGDAALNSVSRNLGLAMTAEDIARRLVDNPQLRTADGRFNRAVFDNYLRDNGLTEAAFIQQQRQETVRAQLIEGLTGGFAAPDAMMQMVHRYRAEERTVSHITIPGVIPASLDAPAETVLKALHEQRKAAFRAPEYRRIQIMTALPQEFAATMTVTDAELQAAYERGIAANRFGTPEKRQIQQIVFPTREAAAAAAAKLAAGTTFEALVQEMNLKPADVELGLKAKSELVDRAVADAAFALALNTVSAPISNAFGAALVRVTEIAPGNIPPLDSIRDTLRSDVITQKMTGDRGVRGQLDQVHDKIEELRSSGKSLDLVAAELKRTLTVIDAIDAQGRNKAGEPVEGLPEPQEVLRALFLSDRGVDNEVLRTRDNGYIWFEVLAVEQARERNFDEVKTQVLEAWRVEEANSRTLAAANELLKKAEGGMTFEALATEANATIETVQSVTRGGQSELPASAVATAFALQTGGYAIAASGRGTDRLLLRVDSLSVPPYDPAGQGQQQLRAQLANELSREMRAQFTSQAQRSLGVSINERTFAQVTGAQPQR
jgi:peptidyl-prolyl cis-trans isomerase D